MIEPTNFPEANTRMCAPSGMDNCDDIVALITRETVVTCWRVSPEALEEIKRTGRVWLSVRGDGMPPVSISVEKPFERA